MNYSVFLASFQIQNQNLIQILMHPDLTVLSGFCCFECYLEGVVTFEIEEEEVELVERVRLEQWRWGM